jgi:response regulator RpfG family c-di-GMP phosphodiesterase
VPSSWDRYPEDAKTPGSQGHATYALRVLLPENSQGLALYIRNVLTAYDLYINRKRVRRIGRAADGPKEAVPEYRHVIVHLSDQGSPLDLVFHVSNYHHRLGGIWAVPLIGPEQQLVDSKTHRLAMNIFMVGSIFIMGLYHISLFLLRKSHKPPVYLGGFCLLIALRALVTNELYLHALAPAIPWEILVKLEYLSYYLAVPVFVMFIASLFPHELKTVPVRIVQGIAAVFSLVVVVFPARIFSHTVPAYQALTLVGLLYMSQVLVRAAMNRREGSWAIIFGFAFLLVTVVNDILHANRIIESAYIFQGGMFVFVFCQAFVLSHRYSLTFETVENQALDLIGMNTVLSREIHARQKLETRLVESHENFKNSRIALILGLAKLAEYRDTETGTHLERMREYARIIARKMADLPMYTGYITEDYVEDIFQSAILHDIGKIGIRDAILLKPGPLTPQEYEIMKTHTIIGGDAITEVAAKIKTRSFLTLAKEIAYHHHERWDGTGYPYGLSGDKIPLSARIVALADVYDALTSARPYKEAFSHKTALGIIREGRGCQFDPDVVDAFCSMSEAMKTLGEALRD